MTWRRALGAAALLSTTALACEVILGIGDDHFRVADAATIPDPCIHVLPPPPPDASDQGANLPNLVFAIDQSTVSGVDDAGQPVGFDLDGVCTCDTRPGSAHGGAPSCVSRDPDASACDGEGGVDNVSAINFPPSLARFTDSNFLQQVGCGRETMLIQLSGYNGQPDDPAVLVAIAPSFGIFDPHEGGVEDFTAAADCGAPGNSTPGPDSGYPAKLDGTDIWSVPAASAEEGVLTERYAGYVTKGQLVVKLEANGDTGGWSVIVGGRVLPFRTTIFAAKLNKQPNGNYRLDHGIITARVPADDLLSTVGALRIQTDQYVCDSALYQPVKDLLCRSLDVAKLPSADFTGARCDAISITYQFSAGPAAIGGSVEAQTTFPAGCGVGFQDSCGN
jgi:hypothetical protein